MRTWRVSFEDRGWCCVGIEVVDAHAGLLDHLLSHLHEQTVTADGERLRRHHDEEGHMVRASLGSEQRLGSKSWCTADEECLLHYHDAEGHVVLAGVDPT